MVCLVSFVSPVSFVCVSFVSCETIILDNDQSYLLHYKKPEMFL